LYSCSNDWVTGCCMWTARTQSLRRCQVSSSKFSGSCGFSVSPQERYKGGGQERRQWTSPANCAKVSSGRVQGRSVCDGGKLTLLQGDRQLLGGLGSSPTSLGSPPASSSSKHSPCALLHIFSPQIPLSRHLGELRRALGCPLPHQRHQLPAPAMKQISWQLSLFRFRLSVLKNNPQH